MSYRIGFIGAGRVAWHLAPALKNSGQQIVQVISRSLSSAKKLGDRAGCSYSDDLRQLDHTIEILFLTVGDDALVNLIGEIADFKGMVVHTSGTFPSMAFQTSKLRFGVFYPLQTFTMERPLDMSGVPVFIEGCDPAAAGMLTELASGFSCEIHHVTEEERKWIHLAGVWASNFTNHMLGNAYDIMNNHSLPVQWLRPLIQETFEKALVLDPKPSQTGPAIRHDQNTLASHLNMLSYSIELKELYDRISRSIQLASDPQKNNRS